MKIICIFLIIINTFYTDFFSYLIIFLPIRDSNHEKNFMILVHTFYRIKNDVFL